MILVEGDMGLSNDTLRLKHPLISYDCEGIGDHT